MTARGEKPPKDRPYRQRSAPLGVGPIFRRLLAPQSYSSTLQLHRVRVVAPGVEVVILFQVGQGSATLHIERGRLHTRYWQRAITIMLAIAVDQRMTVTIAASSSQQRLILVDDLLGNLPCISFLNQLLDIISQQFVPLD